VKQFNTACDTFYFHCECIFKAHVHIAQMFCWKCCLLHLFVDLHFLSDVIFIYLVIL